MGTASSRNTSQLEQADAVAREALLHAQKLQTDLIAGTQILTRSPSCAS
jgi:hypothetical protein